MSCAFAQAGPMQIELIEQHTDGPSVYRDMFPAGTGGFHHLCYWADGTMPAKWVQTESKLYTADDDNQAVYEMKKGLGY